MICFGRWAAILLSVAALLAACVSSETPSDSLQRYAHALREARLDDAYAMLSPAEQAAVSRKDFESRYSSPSQRVARAAQLEQIVGQPLRAGPIELAFERGGWRVRDTPASASETLQAFVDDVRSNRFAAAYGLLTAGWRARYTPERFQRDFFAEPSSKDKLARAQQALTTSPTFTATGAEFPIGQGRAVRLLLEPGGYRLAALE